MRLVAPGGTIVEVDNELAQQLQSRGWRREPQPSHPKPEPEPPTPPVKRGPGRPKKN